MVGPHVTYLVILLFLSFVTRYVTLARDQRGGLPRV